MPDLDDLELADIARAQFPGDELRQRQWIMDHKRGQLDEALGKDSGDGEGFSMASAMPWLQMIAPIIKTGADMGVQAIEKSEADAKAARERRAYAAAHADEARAAAEVSNLRKGAFAADADAAAAAAKASYERDPRGPLHVAAERAAKLAAMMHTGTDAAAAKFSAAYAPPAPAPIETKAAPWWQRLPPWAPYAAGGAVALTIVGALYLALRRSK